MRHITIYTADFTRLKDDFYFGYGSFFTNRKAAQKECDHMNALHDAKDNTGEKGWRYIIHTHKAFSW